MKLEVTGHRLMQRVGAEPGRPPNTASWFEDPHSNYKHHAAYLNRLRKLRQDLIEHEHKKLTKALERFQLRDSDSTFCLSQRIPGRAVFKLHAHNALPVRSYSNASEKFRKAKRHEEPRLETIQGKQLLEPQIDPEYVPPPQPASVDRLEIDKTVRENLKRLLQPKPSCSIPTIGRRNVQHYYGSEKDSSTDSTRDSGGSLCVKRSQTHHKFALTTGTRNRKKKLIRPDTDELDLSPATFKFERFSRNGLNSRPTESRDRRLYDVYYMTSSPETGMNTPDPQNGSRPSTPSSNDQSEQFNEQDQSQLDLRPTLVLPLISEERPPRRRIVVDMPDIILYPATPDVETKPVTKGGQLAKVHKQNQLREREITNLLEDVKEIHNRTETLENKFSIRES